MQESDDHKSGLPPVVDEQTRVLILGSLPSDDSIAAQQYYANPDNHFWFIVYSVLDAGSPQEEYDDRISFLRSAGIGLWDVLHSANRKGSTDAAIRREAPNDIAALLERYPRVDRLLLNGGKARDLYAKHCRDARLSGLYVPSSSPTPGKNVLPVPQRIVRWREAMGLGWPV